MPDLIRYDLLVQDALRGVVRQVLTEVARNGLQGDHHFFITFKTATPSLRLSNRMRERYPDEMTIILQHQFWDLAVADTGFEVGLSFNNNPERLFIPFVAITAFQDPSVNFGLKFDVRESAVPPPAESPAGRPALAEAPTKGLPAKRALAPVDSDKAPVPAPARNGSARAAEHKPTPDKAVPDKPRPVIAKLPDKPKEGEDGTKVVSIDAFRKKP